MPRPRVILKPRRALPFFGRHPWVFAGAIRSVEADGHPVEPGDEVSLHSSDGEFIARGLINHHSNIRVRLYSWVDQDLDDEFWAVRLRSAIEMRLRLFIDSATDAYRLVFSESDGLSGLIVDRYADWLVIQFTSLAMHRRREQIVRFLNETLQPRGIWLRTDRGILESEGLELQDGLQSGVEPERPLFIRQGDLRFGVDLAEGQKTGFYLDQRCNREAVARYCHGKRVLDCFCYTGAFSIGAAGLGQAREVLGLDSAEPAIRTAIANAELNGVAARCRFEKSEVKARLNVLKEAGEQFDVVILDPPKMARSRGGIERALTAYLKMNASAVELLPSGGTLVTACCSGLISRTQFEQTIGAVSKTTGRAIRVLETLGQPPDHPVSVTCAESRYLKLLICEVD